jgi:clan AA aspartic protease (TIGR02281 family)
MRLDPNAPIIIVSVEIGGESGSKLVDMALDTGATYVMIPWQVAEALGHDPAVSTRRVNLTTASSVEIAPLITLRWVRALDQEFTDVDAACHDLPPGSRVQGLLGLSFLKYFDVDLHFLRGVLEARR